MTCLIFWGPNHISGTAKARVVKFVVHLRLCYIKC